jgi:hypothetical protein
MLSRDVGITTLPGSGNFANGTFTLKGSGYDIWNASDEFQYVHHPLNGDGEIIARVTSVQNTSAAAKAGVMIRETLNGNSKHALLALRPNGQFEFVRRTSTGGSSTGTQVTANTTPNNWVRLTRSGSNIASYKSADGTNWTQVGSTVSITMSSSVLVGLAVSSVDDTVLNTATFDNVTIGRIGDRDDTDGDGIINMLERAFGSNPMASDTSALPTISIESDFAQLTYRRSLAASDLLFQAEWSTNLQSWSTAGVTDMLTSTDEGVETRVSKVLNDGQSRRFMRLRITWQP